MSDNCLHSQSLDSILYGESIALILSGRAIFSRLLCWSPITLAVLPQSQSPLVSSMRYNYSWHLSFWLGHIYKARWQDEVTQFFRCLLHLNPHKAIKILTPKIMAAWIFRPVYLTHPDYCHAYSALCKRCATFSPIAFCEQMQMTPGGRRCHAEVLRNVWRKEERLTRDHGVKIILSQVNNIYSPIPSSFLHAASDPHKEWQA